MPHVDVSLLPLQVVAQYPLSKLQDLFQEVVHGATWSSRKLLPFGIPNSALGTQRLAGEDIRYWIAQHTLMGSEFQTQKRHMLFSGDVQTECSGEGLMLWDQRALWEPRGRSSRVTQSILKFKPRVVSVGTVRTAQPEHTHRRRGSDMVDVEGLEQEDGHLPGYTVSVDWWDNLQGRWVSLRPYVSANYGAAQPVVGADTRTMEFDVPNCLPPIRAPSGKVVCG